MGTLSKQDWQALSQKLLRRETTVSQTLEPLLSAMADGNAQAHAFVWIDVKRTTKQEEICDKRWQAGHPRPLEGLLLAVKDNADVQSMPTRHGSRCAADTVAGESSGLIKKLEAAGAVIVGKTNLPELATLPHTMNALDGITPNYWDKRYTAGGSSGGSAVAVAAGWAIAGHGNDGGGSLRIPASCASLFALKPARGRLSKAPDLGDVLAGWATDGFITRSVEDTADLLDNTAGYELGDPYWLSSEPVPFSLGIRQSLRSLRIGWTAHAPLGLPVHPAARQAVQTAAEACRHLGHHVQEHTPRLWTQPEETAAIVEDMMKFWAVGTAWSARVLSLKKGTLLPDCLETHNARLWEAGHKVSAPEYLQLMMRLQKAARYFMESWQQFDVILTPMLAMPPLSLDDVSRQMQSGAGYVDFLMKGFGFSPFALWANLTGQPAAQWPVFWANGLPLGVQAIGPAGGDMLLLQLSFRLQQAGFFLPDPPERH
ncbi:MAG: amidase [Firmicutes bacterium]|nr:amidase [Bacillota bacterium]